MSVTLSKIFIVTPITHFFIRKIKKDEYNVTQEIVEDSRTMKGMNQATRPHNQDITFLF